MSTPTSPDPRPSGDRPDPASAAPADDSPGPVGAPGSESTGAEPTGAAPGGAAADGDAATTDLLEPVPVPGMSGLSCLVRLSAVIAGLIVLLAVHAQVPAVWQRVIEAFALVAGAYVVVRLLRREV